MRFNGFVLCVRQSSDLLYTAEREGGYVDIVHGGQYSLYLSNEGSTRCDVQVDVDGKEVGTWRLDAHDHIVIERPANDTGRFTFFKVGTDGFRQAGLESVSANNLGLITARFKPECTVRAVRAVSPVQVTWWYPYPYLSYPRYFPNMSVMATSTCNANITGTQGYATAIGSAVPGGTGLTGKSDQQFSVVAPLDYDTLNETIIHLRLRCIEDAVQAVAAVKGRETPVPALVK